MGSPIVTATWQAGLLAAISNVLAQLITCYRNKTTYVLDVPTLFQFVLFSILACPPNCVWQSYLEARFPAHQTELTVAEKEVLVDDTRGADTLNGHAHSSEIKEKVMVGDNSKSTGRRQLNLKNTAIKFALDQTVGAAVNVSLIQE